MQTPEKEKGNSQKREYVCKIIVVGDVGTGKTSLIRRYTQGVFAGSYKATIGVDFCLKEIQLDQNTIVSLQLWDVAGQERFAHLTRMYYKEARGAFVVFDVTRSRTFDAVLKWKEDIDAKVQSPNGGSLPTVLLANKCDLTPQIDLELDAFCKEHGFLRYFKTSAKENIGISDASKFLVDTILETEDQGEVRYSSTGMHLDVPPIAQSKRAAGCCST